ncbi:NUDIX hydrolase [Streptomyces colonosanans]|uniref:NUDIX hydrolase n=1 Tax=Streptomyces colonosanans TaxID=1428652 RepID=UPI000AD8A6B1|nr:NUDIX domain-containing protein [Streptomyces colonosanans]
MPSVSVAGVVVREDGRLLAIRRADNGTWELPGGVLELNETPEAGVAREALEETGIHIEVDELTGVYKNMTRGVVALVFRCKPSAGGSHGAAAFGTGWGVLALSAREGDGRRACRSL